MDIPMEIYDHIARSVSEEPYDDSQPWRCHARSSEDSQSLQNLRLVNRTFCQAASPVLFARVGARSMRGLQNLLQIAESGYSGAVSQVLVGSSGDFSAQHAQPNVFLTDLSIILPICVRNLPNLQVLSIETPAMAGVAFSEESRALFVRAVYTTFGYGILKGLIKLTLTLPLAYDFASLAHLHNMPRKSLANSMRQIRHLSVEVRDDTGKFGQRYFHNSQSRSHSLYPNHFYAKSFFKFVGMAVNLVSLRVCCTHVLDMDLLQVQYFRRLTVLALCRVKVSASHLQSLVAQNAKAMQTIELSALELKSGTWEDIFLSCCSLPCLRAFNIYSCGYDTQGASQAHAMALLPPIDDPMDLETLHFEDLDALGNLQRHVMRLREAAGLTQIGEYYYKYGHKMDEHGKPIYHLSRHAQ